MLEYELTRRAERDIARAADWYDRQRPALGNELVDAVYVAIWRAREHPESYPENRRGVRSIKCKRFPYRVHFKLLTDRIDVLAVYHTSRDPDRWEDADRD